MNKKNFLIIASLIAVVLLIYYPLFFTEYAYTDELVQLWYYKKGNNYNMFVPLGRNITDLLFNWLFSSIDTIKGITRLRLFSLFGWICCIPVWYYMLKEIVVREGLPERLCYFTLLYLFCCPAFSVSVQWAACMELFMANTAGLVSGYMLYKGLQLPFNSQSKNAGAILLSILFGLISLFTYQNGFGCFFLPFIIHLVAKKKLTQMFWQAMAMSIIIFAGYYIVFKWSLKLNQIPSSDRAGITTDPWHKLIFFFTRPMASAFHFTFLFNERNLFGSFVYAIVFVTWAIFTFFRRLTSAVKDKVIYFAGLLSMLLLIYLPSLLVKENYSSNRTLLALDIAVCLLFFETVFSVISNQHKQLTAIVAIATVFVINAWFNFSGQFLKPVKHEYQVLRTFVVDNYHKGIDTVYFIRPPENMFQKSSYIAASWDEFGVPSSFFEWVPEFFVRQVVYEKTGNRKQAESLVIKNWAEKESFDKAVAPVSNRILLVDAGKLLSRP